MDNLEARVLRRVEALGEELLARTQEVLRCASITGWEDRVAPLFAQLLEDIGLEVDVWAPTYDEVKDHFPFADREERLGQRPNVVGVWRGQGGGRSLILNGHMDVVPPGEASEWERDPFSGYFDGKNIYGRGACDMKGPLMAAMMAIKALRLEGFQPAGDIIVECVMGEELGGVGTIAALLRGYTADAAIVMEPTELRISPAQGGHLKWKIEVQGQGSHTSVPWHGVSAFEKWTAVYEALRDLEKERNRRLSHPLFDDFPSKVPFACGRVESGLWPYMVPERLAAYGRIGALPGESLADVRRAVEDKLRAVAATDPWLKAHPPHITWVDGEFPGWETPTDHPIVAALSEAYRRALGAAPSLAGVTYGTDASFLHNAGIPCVVFGAGGIQHAHRPNEFVALDDLLVQTKVMALAVARWTGRDG